MTILYLAGGSSERLAVCRPLVDHLLSAGVPVAYDWTRDPGWDTPGGPSAADLLASARRDLEAVRRAHVLWYVAPAAPSEGSAAELGAALAMGKRVVVSGPHARAAFRMFPLLATESYGTHEEALAALVEEGRKERAVVAPVQALFDAVAGEGVYRVEGVRGERVEGPCRLATAEEHAETFVEAIDIEGIVDDTSGTFAACVRLRDAAIAKRLEERAAKAKEDAEAHKATLDATPEESDLHIAFRLRVARCEGQAHAYRAAAALLGGAS